MLVRDLTSDAKGLLRVGQNLHKFLVVAQQRTIQNMGSGAVGCEDPKPLDLRSELWIDAICIDQTREDEKVHQVATMDYVFAQVTRTIIWLGRLASNGEAQEVTCKDRDEKWEWW